MLKKILNIILTKHKIKNKSTTYWLIIKTHKCTDSTQQKHARILLRTHTQTNIHTHYHKKTQIHTHIQRTVLLISTVIN